MAVSYGHVGNVLFHDFVTAAAATWIPSMWQHDCFRL